MADNLYVDAKGRGTLDDGHGIAIGHVLEDFILTILCVPADSINAIIRNRRYIVWYRKCTRIMNFLPISDDL